MFDVGITTFMILATSMVMLMTPGLAFFYGGLGSRKHILNIMMQSFVSLVLTTVLWFFFGYSLCFSGNMTDGTDLFGIIGNLDKAMFQGITPRSVFSPERNFPEYIFIAYQMMFAIITPALITRFYQPDFIQSIYLVPDFLAGICLLSVCSHGLGWRTFSCMGSS